MAQLEFTVLHWSTLSEEQKQRALQRPVTARQDDLRASVAKVIQQVREEGDTAVRRLTQEFDRVQLESFVVTEAEWTQAIEQVEKDVASSLARAMKMIESFHRQQMPKTLEVDTAPGVRCEKHYRPIERVGLYIPGGTAPLPSTVLMLGVPARLAGARVRVLCSPPNRAGGLDPAILYAARLCGIQQVYKIGGAQAVAALAYGTQSVPKVDKIFGPGNSYVTEAKMQVAQDVRGAAIDLPAGPSELMVIIDEGADVEFAAADLLSQAEHGTDSQVVLVSLSATATRNVLLALERQLVALPRRNVAVESLAQSRVIEVNSLDEALEVANHYAPEHLSLQVREPRGCVEKIENAGSVFLGPWSPESVGDYASGTNHVLPTYGWARSQSGVSLDSFFKSITFQELSRAGLADIGSTVEIIAKAEGLEAHRRAVSVRLAKLGKEESR